MAGLGEKRLNIFEHSNTDTWVNWLIFSFESKTMCNDEGRVFYNEVGKKWDFIIFLCQSSNALRELGTMFELFDSVQYFWFSGRHWYCSTSRSFKKRGDIQSQVWTAVCPFSKYPGV